MVVIASEAISKPGTTFNPNNLSNIGKTGELKSCKNIAGSSALLTGSHFLYLRSAWSKHPQIKPIARPKNSAVCSMT